MAFQRVFREVRGERTRSSLACGAYLAKSYMSEAHLSWGPPLVWQLPRPVAPAPC